MWHVGRQLLMETSTPNWNSVTVFSFLFFFFFPKMARDEAIKNCPDLQKWDRCFYKTDQAVIVSLMIQQSSQGRLVIVERRCGLWGRRQMSRWPGTRSFFIHCDLRRLNCGQTLKSFQVWEVISRRWMRKSILTLLQSCVNLMTCSLNLAGKIT